MSMLGKINVFIKNWWHVYIAIAVIAGGLSTSVGYYARAEAVKIIDKRIQTPVQNLQRLYENNKVEANKRNEDLKKTLETLKQSNRKLNQDSIRREQQIKGINDKFDILLKVLNKQNKL